MSERNYEDDELREFVEELDEGQQKLLRLYGGLPASFKIKELSSSDVARMIEIVEDEK